MAAVAGALQSTWQQYGLLASAQETSISNKLSHLVRQQEFIDQLSNSQLLKNVLFHGGYPMIINSINDNFWVVYYLQDHSDY